CQQYKSAPYSF
nr:immunoglobulin light chain junction region [Macaca mulatta]